MLSMRKVQNMNQKGEKCHTIISKLKGKIVEKYWQQAKFAEDMEWSERTLFFEAEQLRLRGNSQKL